MRDQSFVTPKGELVYDFGQNLTGWVEVQISGRPGQILTLHHAESLDENGNFYTGNLSFAKGLPIPIRSMARSRPCVPTLRSTGSATLRLKG